MSSALTQPGDPTGKRVLARVASSRAVLKVAAHEGRLRGCEIGPGEVVLLAVGHRELAVCVRRFRLAGQRSLQNRDRLVDARAVVGGDQRLPEHDLDQGRAWCERIACRSGAIASAGLPASSSAWPLSSWK